MRDFQTQDGIVLRNVPDDVPDEQIKARIQQIRQERDVANIQSQAEPSQVTPVDQTKGPTPLDEWQQRAIEIDQAPIAPARKFLQSSALGVEYLFDKLTDIPYVDNAMKSLGNAIDSTVLQTPTAKLGIAAMKAGEKPLKEFEEEYPHFARDLKAIGTIGSTMFMGVPTGKTVVKRAFFNKGDYLEDIVKPLKVRKTDLRNIDTEGPRGKIVVGTSSDQKEMAKLLGEIQGVRSGTSPAELYKLAGNEISRKADDLRSKLKGSKKKITKLQIVNALEKAMEKADRMYDKSDRLYDIRSPNLSIDQLQKNSENRRKFIDDIMEKVGDPKNTGDLLEARQLVDERFRYFSNDRRMKTDGGLIPTRKEEKWRASRDALNDLIENLEPGYKSDLRKQHMLYRSMDAIEDRVYKQMKDEQRTFTQKYVPEAVKSLLPPVIRK